MKPIILAAQYFIILLWSSPAYTQSVTLRDKIGQMLMVGFQGYEVPAGIAADLTQRNLGGVILMGRNLADPFQILDLTTNLKQHATLPLLIATDQEGGRVARLNASNGFGDSYSHYQLGTTFANELQTRQTAGTMAHWLAGVGINLNLAPVADVNVNPLSPAIGRLDRSFSNDPEKVYQHAAWFIDEFHQQNIITTLKHFPGHGSAKDDSHNGFTDITTTWGEEELLPYKKLMEDEAVDLIMIGHLFNAEFDSLYPASLSYNTITGLLREQMGYQGVVVSDDLFNMRAITDNYGFDEAVVLAINAGMDILLYVWNEIEGQPLVSHIIDLVEQRVNTGAIAASRIDESYQRIFELKQKWFNVTAVDTRIASSHPPVRFELRAYPNPFKTTTQILLHASEITPVSVKIYDLTGKEIASLAEGENLTRDMSLQFNAAALAPGVYFVRAQSREQIVTRKITLIR